MYFGFENNLNEIFHPRNIRDDPQRLTAYLLIVNLDYEIDQDIDQLTLDQLILRIGHEQFPVIK